MKSTEIYKRFLIKVNKNDSNDGINILPSIFVLMFNSEAIRWLSETLDTDGDNIKLDTLDRLLETDVEFNLVGEVTASHLVIDGEYWGKIGEWKEVYEEAIGKEMRQSEVAIQ